MNGAAEPGRDLLEIDVFDGSGSALRIILGEQSAKLMEMNKKLVSEIMREMGKIGGKRSMETMTKEERAERARKAAAKSAEVRSKRAAKKRK